MSNFDQKKYIADYVKENYDRMTVRLPKGQLLILKERAAQKGMSINGYITHLINKDANDERKN